MREFFELFEILKRKDNHYRLHIGYTSVCEYSMQIDYGFPEDFEKEGFSILIKNSSGIDLCA